MGDSEVVGTLPVLRDDADVVDGREPERLDSGEQWGVVNEDRDGSDFNKKSGGYFVAGVVLSATDGMDTDKLMGVLVMLVNARGVREDDCRENILLVVKMREQRQRARGRDWGQR